jgi:hypothetical protein
MHLLTDSHPGVDGLNRVRGFAGQRKKTTLHRCAIRLPVHGAFFVRQSDKFFVFLRCRREVPAENLGQACPEQGNHQSGTLADVARFLEPLLCVRKSSFWTASHPLRPRPKTHIGHSNV